MHLVVINPIGLITSLDLHALPLWRLETRAIPWPGTSQKGLALGIAYPNAPAPGFAAIIAINCQVEGDEVEPIARVGLPGTERGAMKERLREAVSSLVNSNVPTKDVDDIKVAASTLVDTYHTLMQQMWGFNPPLAAMGTDAKGELQGWRWVLLRSDRFASWIGDGGTMAPPSAAAFEPPKIPAASPSKPVTAPTDSLIPFDPLAGNLGPPPDDNGPPRRGKKQKEA